MEFVKQTLNNGTELYVYQSDIYTHTTVDFNFYSRKDAGNAANALANMILMEGSKNFPTLQAISLASEKEYGAGISGKSVSVGDLQATGVYINVLTKASLIAGQKTLENMAGLMADILAFPLIGDGGFKQEYFDEKKEELLLQAKQMNLNKDYFAKKRFLETALGDSPFVLPSSGSEEDISKLDNATVTRAYAHTLNHLPRKIFIGTNLKPEYVIQVFDNSLRILPQVQADIRVGEVPTKSAATRKEEASNFDQSVVFVGVPVIVPRAAKERQALGLLNFYLGGFHGARLFTEIRTKRDMAYGAYSNLDRELGLIYGKAAVDLKNKDKTIELMLKEISKIVQGKITKSGFESAKGYLLNTRLMRMHAKHDRLDAIESCVLGDRLEDLANYETAYEDITYEDVVNAASFVKNEPVVYCLLQGDKK